MNQSLTHDQIMEYIAAGCAVTVRTGDSIVTIRPLPARGESPPMSAADRARAYRARKSTQSVTPPVTVEPGTVTRHAANVTNDPENSPSPSPPSPDPSLPAHTPARESASACEGAPPADPPDAKPTRTRFTPPSLPAWIAYAATLTPPYPAQRAETVWNHYAAKGWRIGKDPMKNWQAACRTCHGKWKSEGSPPPQSPRPAIGPNHGSANQAAIDEYK